MTGGAGDFELPSREGPERLSRISTSWSLVMTAHGVESAAVPEAQRELLQRYCGAAYRYLLGAVRDEQQAADLFQDFALRFLRGDFRRADPGRGRFRDYVRTALIHLVSDHRNANRNRPISLPGDIADRTLPASEPDSDREFIDSWREELLARSWADLESTHRAMYVALLHRVENPDATAQEIADALNSRSEGSYSASHIRVLLHRARGKFSSLLVAQVAHSLEDATHEALQAELRVLGLLPYCEQHD